MAEFRYISQPPAATDGQHHRLLVCGEDVLCFSNPGRERIIFDDKELGFLPVGLEKFFLCFCGQTPCYVQSLAVKQRDDNLPEGYQWRSLRSLLGILSDDHFNWAGRATQVLSAYRDHRFCGRCGSLTQPVVNEHASTCSSCDLSFYPRLSPCAIMVITRGEYCLLARNVGWGNWFSALAGFVEAGETVEQTVRRETLEEVGIRVGELTYIGSQPWPFPGQLMLGFHAEYESGHIIPDQTEIAEAGWYRYDALPPHPGIHTLSGQLIKRFVDQF